MIKYNLNNINDWNFGEDNIIKVYRNNAVCYYKVTSGDTPTPVQEPCFAVVDNILQYSETEFEDVFNLADEKWYKLNNLNQYEKYGIYGSGRTSCEGSTSRLPQGYTEVEYIENTSTAYIDTGAYLNTSNFEIGYTIGNKQQLFGYCHQGCGSCTWLGVEQSALMFWGNNNNSANISSYLTSSENTITFTQSGATVNGTSISKTLSIGSDNISNVSLLIFARYDFKNNVVEHRTDSYMQLKSFYLKNNGTLVRDLVPAKRNSDDKYGMYDIVNDVFYLSPNNVDFSGGEPITPTDCVTTYEGKLTIDDGYEYMYSGGSWVNLGEVSGSSVTIKSPEYIQRTSSFNGYCSLLEYFTEDTKIIVKHRQTNAGGAAFIGDYFNNDNDDWRVFFASRTLYYDFITQRKSVSKTMPMPSAEEWEIGNYYIKNTATSTNLITGTHQSFSSRPNEMYLYYLGGFGNVTDYGEVYYVKIYKNDVLVRDFIPWTDMNGNYGLYDKVEGELVHTVGNMTASTVINDVEVGGGYEYPLYYVVREYPPDNLVFSTMTEAEEYECPWVGMKATIDGDKYIFSGDSQSGYEWVYNPSRLPQGYTEVEYIQNTGTSYINTNLQLCSATTNTFQVEAKLVGNRIGSDTYQNIFACMSEAGEPYQGFTYRFQGTTITPAFIPSNDGSFTQVTNEDSTISVTASSINGLTYSHTYPLTICCGLNSSRNPFRYTNTKVYTFKVTLNNTVVADYVPAMRDSDSKYGLYDLITDTFLVSPNGSNFVGGSPV